MDLTLQNCIDIKAQTNNFIHKKENLLGFAVHQFEYILAVTELFGAHPHAREMRGITFIQNDWWTLRYLMLRKFFNINEHPETMEENLKQYPITSVQDKLDGSMIRFIKFPNFTVLAKSKFSFQSPQAVRAQEIYDNSPKLKEFINVCHQKGIAAIFELIGDFNRIIVKYDELKLILIQARKENTGEYLDIYSDPLFDGIEKTKSYPEFKTIDSIKEYLKGKENFEGFVVCINGVFIKMKCDWYIKLHTMMDELLHEDIIIDLVLTDKIDDVLSDISGQISHMHDYAIKLRDFVYKYLLNVKDQIQKIHKDNEHLNRKEVAIKFKDHKLVSFIMDSYQRNTDEFIIGKLKRQLAKDCYRLEGARKFLKDNGFTTVFESGVIARGCN